MVKSLKLRLEALKLYFFDNVAPDLTWVAVIAVLHLWETVIKM
jgi:hypothetical protein